MTYRGCFHVLCVLEPRVQRLDMPEQDIRMKADIPRMGLEGGPVPPEVGSAIQRARGGGQPLERGLQERMSASFRHDFSDVRVHTGPDADELNRQLSADAFTVGSDIFFAQGAYDPDTRQGGELITHELVHVVQQRTGRVSGGGSGMTVRPAGDAFEQDADAIARQASTARCESGTRTAMSGIQRHWDSEEHEGEEELQRKMLNPAPGLLPPHAVMPTKRYVVGTRTRAMGNARQSLIIQRSATTLVNKARSRPDAAVAPNCYGPQNCNEAVIGWLLKAEGYTHAWQLVRRISQTFLFPNNIGTWMMAHIYQHRHRLQQADVAGLAFVNVQRGDILFTATVAGPNPVHSMVVVTAPPNTKIRGFNNSGTFAGVPGLLPAPLPGAYDIYDRDITALNLWYGPPLNQTFGAGAMLYRVTYNDAVNALQQALQHWTYSWFRTPGWRHANPTPLVPCPPDCPH